MRSIIRNMINRRGYTIDQTILVVAIIAILITLIIITLGWTLLSRTSGSKLGTFTDQIENATSTYYGAFKVMPGSASAPATGMPITDLNTAGYLKFRNNGGSFFHDVGGAAGIISGSLVPFTAAQAAARRIGGGLAGTYLVVTFSNVPSAELAEADRGIDGQPDMTTGKFVYTAGAGTDCAGTVTGNTYTTPTTIGMGCFIGPRAS
jgi:hypothetical protein